MKIAVIGAGGTGGYYGGLFARAGHDVTFVARGANLLAIRKNGLQVKSVHGDFTITPAAATDDPYTITVPDFVLFCTKTYDTEEAVQKIKPIIGPETIVLSLQNGIDAIDRIGNVIGINHMIAGTTWISSALEAPGVVNQVSDFRRVAIGELNGESTPRIRAVYKVFNETGISVQYSENILEVLWAKFIFISAAGSFGSLTRLPIGAYRDIPETRDLIIRLMREVEAVARRLNIQLETDIVDRTLAFIDQAGPQIKASMQLDVAGGRPTEIELIIGVIGRKGRELSVATPVADMLYALLLPVDSNARRILSRAV